MDGRSKSVSVAPDKVQSKDTVSIEISSTAKQVTIGKESFRTGGWPGKRIKPLYNGEHKRLFVTDEDLEIAEGTPAAVRLNAAVRERYFNKALHQYIKNDTYQQVLILGSGLDTRAYKKNTANQQNKNHSVTYSKVKFYEVDCRTLLAAKEKRFQEMKLDKNAEYICADYTIDNFLAELKDRGMNFSLPTLIIWEGNSMYIEKSKIEKLFHYLKSNLQTFSIVFDHFSRYFIDVGPTENSQYALHRLHRQGLYKTGFNPEDVKNLANNFGMNVLSTVSIDVFRKDYEVDEYQERSEYFISTVVSKI